MKKLSGFLAIAFLAASPAATSVREVAFASTADRAQPRTSMFVGATYRLDLDGKAGKPRSRASLQLSGMMSAPDASNLRIDQGLEIAGGKAGKPALLIAGRDAGELGDRAHLGTGATIAVVVVGVVVVAGVVAALLIDERLDRQNSE